MSKKFIEIDNRLRRIEGLLLQKKKVLNFEEAVEYTGYSKSYLYRLTSSNEIPFFKPTGKMIFFERETLDSYLLSNKRKSFEELDKLASNYLLQK